ncbi:MAG: hypothetical protein A2X28_07240 [Elusimicrobia bacterium GWA2_56_46]|nr:MAG: hypothetical protein A2X28_07240 [Elusimicrobia bacterium GWA2_56_46]OGR54761.1 MAG: hypothetical protein A2X39_10750 [Elusimicrobia bacterium GWC2_56_31]HBB66019.1 hypothetical protein [Elusimicrobiota bacterium]
MTFAAVALTFLSARPASAALSISAETDKTTVEINDSLYLTLTVTGDSASVPEPALPRMDNFNVYSSGRSQNISIINGKISTSVAFTYILSPRFIGKQKIPPISVFNGKEKYLTQEIEITVTKAAATAHPPGTDQSGRPARRQPSSAETRTAMKPEDLLYLTAETDKKAAYPNEQINLTIRFYTAVPLTSNPQYVPPQFKNLISEDLPPVRNGETVVKGARYSYSEIKTALFGIEEGRASVNPASVVAQIHSESAIDPFDPNFFQQFFSMSAGQGETRRVASNPVEIRILPLPAGAPPSFNGAVGNFTLSAGPDHKEIKTGEALNLSVTVAGKGNLKILTAPKLPDMPDFKVYDTMSSLDISKTGDVIGGKKTFTTILIPKTEGRRIIPPIRFSFLDPQTRSYRELTAGPFELLVKKGDGEGKNFSFAHGGQPAGITPLASDIRYVSDRAVPPLLAAAAGRVSALPLWLNLFPAAAVLLSLWLARLNDSRLKNPLLFRFRKAGGAARAGLAAAAEKLAAGRPQEAAPLLYDSLLAYLHGKSGLKASGLTMKRALSLLREKFPDIGEHSLAEIRDLWEKLEAAHFSPGGAGPREVKDMIEKYSSLLDLLEREFKKSKRK